MMKKFSALLLSLALCLGLIGTAFAVDANVSVKAGTNGVTLTGTLQNGTYLLCSIAKDGKPVAAFNITPDDFTEGTNTLSKKIDVALETGDTVTVSIPSKDGTDIKVEATVPSGGSSGGGGGGGGGGQNGHAVRVNSVANGTVTANPRNAVKGEKVTLTIKANQGYVLDNLTVKDANGNTLTLTKVNDTTYTFLMPDCAVTVDASFKLADGTEISFSDVASDYTFYNDIMWVAGKGYMKGYDDGTFRPNNNTTRQALWMVLARIDGANPSSMTAARTWAMNSNVSDGTNPTNPMSRQQMVTMLYRYAQMKGYSTTGGISIAGYPDAGSVANYAKDAMSWAVGNGIVQGTTSGALNPTGTASRAHFAAFLHRFCTTAGIA